MHISSRKGQRDFARGPGPARRPPDVDDDNEISLAEFQVFLAVWNIEDPAAIETFHRLDTDGDGAISRQEYIRSWREFYYSPDPEAAGAWYFGNPN